jgi:hypothetical protein
MDVPPLFAMFDHLHFPPSNQIEEAILTQMRHITLDEFRKHLSASDVMPVVDSAPEAPPFGRKGSLHFVGQNKSHYLLVSRSADHTLPHRLRLIHRHRSYRPHKLNTEIGFGIRKIDHDARLFRLHNKVLQLRQTTDCSLHRLGFRRHDVRWPNLPDKDLRIFGPFVNLVSVRHAIHGVSRRCSGRRIRDLPSASFRLDEIHLAATVRVRISHCNRPKRRLCRP